MASAGRECALLPHRARACSGEILPPRPCRSPAASTGTSPTTASRPSTPTPANSRPQPP